MNICTHCGYSRCRCLITPPVSTGAEPLYCSQCNAYHVLGEHISGGTGLPTVPADRKALPICTGVLDYFPDALAAVAACSKAGNDQHHPGTPLHWDMSKSTDEADSLVRHLIQRGTLDTDGIRHTAKVAWRALALLQREIVGK